MNSTVKICKQCGESYGVTVEDLIFYDKISPVFDGKKYEIPAPTLCPSCRQQRRLAFRNERKLYHRKCDLCRAQVISIYDTNSIYTVYCNNCWWSDQWNALDYGKSFDLGQPFFQQFHDLQRKIPRLALFQKNSENSHFTNHCENNKNCYLCIDTSSSEDIYYSKWIVRCKNSVDCYNIENAELCYEIQYQMKGYRNISNFFSDFSAECFFIYNCKSCKNCFMCNNLERKEYCIRNKQYSKKEYEDFISGIDLGSYQQFKKYTDEYRKMIGASIKRDGLLIMCEDCTGDCLYKCKNVKKSFDIVESQDCHYCYEAGFLKDCHDVYESAFECELQYECHGCNRGKYLKFGHVSYDVSESEYVDTCHNSSNLFGCIGLRRKEYCILNRQYSKEEFKLLRRKIIEHMQREGSWGEFFPITLSPFAYNETIAQEYFPLTKEQCLKLNIAWKNDDFTNKYQGQKIVIPDNIKQVEENIIKQILTCEACAKNYKIIPQELQFYKKLNLPIPRSCPDCRYQARLSMRNLRKLFARACMKCSATIQTTYAPDRTETVYCEKCYLEAVY